MQFHDPDKLITAVQDLLRAQGLDAQLADGRLARTGACMLLRGLGVTPGIEAVDAYTRIFDSGPWPDADDRLAARFAEQHGR